MPDSATLISVVGASFLAAFVEVVEAFTVVLAVAMVRGWRPAILGSVSALVALFVLVVTMGPLLHYVPLRWLQATVGILLLLFGLRWLRKAILRAIGVIPVHDEDATFANETRELSGGPANPHERLGTIALLTAFKAVLLEGLEVVFIVIAVGAARGLLFEAGIGALAACLVVVLIGIAVRKPLSRVPENALKLAVGVMLSAFGLFWTGEGFGIHWPGADAAILVFAGLFLLVAIALVSWLRPRSMEAV
jgi:uncharacterized membrane protein